MSFNRKERLKIAGKIAKKDKWNRPSNTTINWRLKKLQSRAVKEKTTLEEYEEFQASKQQQQEAAFANQGKNDYEEMESADVAESVEVTGNQRKNYTLSIAVPGSILNNAQGPELRTYLAGQIARTCAVFCVNEVIVFDETARLTDNQIEAYHSGAWIGMENVGSNNSECNLHMARILEYLECPQYLRKYLFPIQRPLKFSGVLNPLDGMHHLRSDDFSIPYREGIVLEKPVKKGRGALCDVGLDKELELKIDYPLPPKTRVTVKLSDETAPKRYYGEITSPKAIMKEAGIYWGYSVRIAKSLSEALKNQDIIIGTSERGVAIRDANIPPVHNKRVLLVFGGLKGLESAVDADEQMQETDPADVFPYYINSLPGQGSRIIRTEEAIPITLAALKEYIE